MSTTVDLLATASRFAIAAAIVYFAYQLSQINNNVTIVTQSVDQVSQHIEPALEEARAIRQEVSEVRQLVPEIMTEVAEVRKQIPEVVAEVAEVRKQIPPLLAQVESINQQIDPILLRVDKTVAVVDETQQQIPQILSTADDAIVALDATRKEVLPLVPPALEQIKLSRESIDPTLERVEELVDDVYFKATDVIDGAQKAGQEASEGAVKGFFTGLIKLPVEFVGSLASPIVKQFDKKVVEQLTERDIELIAKTANRAVELGKINKERRWENPKSGNSGSITVTRKFQLQNLECAEARIRISNKRKEILDLLDEFCRNEENKWVAAKELANN